MSAVAKLIAMKEHGRSRSVSRPTSCAPRGSLKEKLWPLRVWEVGAEAQRGDAVALGGGVAVAAEGEGDAAALRRVVHLLVLVLLRRRRTHI